MEFSARDIAALLNGEVEGDGSVKVNNISKIDKSVPGTLTFLSNPAYTKYIYTTTASAVLVNQDFKADAPLSCTLIRVKDAYAALAILLDAYNKMNPAKTGIEQPSFVASSATLAEHVYVGAFAYVGEKAQIGRNVKIYPHVYLGDRVKVGDNTILYSGAKVYADCVIGNSCIIHSGVVIGGDGFGFAPNADGRYTKIEQIGNVILEDFVEIGANTTVDRATMGSTIIHSGVKLDNLIQIAHNVEVGENTVMAAQVGISGSTVIEANCVFGGQAGTAGHIVIGKGSKIGPQAGVISSVKPSAVLMGTPASEFRQTMKAYTIIRKLPELRQEVTDLQKELKKIQNKES